MAKKLKVMFSTHGLVEGDFGFELDEKGYPTSKVISKKVITGQDTGGQVYYVKALAANSNNYDVDLVTRRVDPRICPQFGGTPHDLGKDINYTIEQQWHDSSVIRSRVLRVPAGGHFNFVPKEEIVPLLPEIINNLYDFYKKEDCIDRIEVVEGHYRDGMLAADMLCSKIEQETGRRPVMLVTSHSLGHKKYERNLPQYQAGNISEEEWKWHNFEQRIKHETFAFHKSDIIIATSPDEQTRLLAEPFCSGLIRMHFGNGTSWGCCKIAPFLDLVRNGSSRVLSGIASEIAHEIFKPLSPQNLHKLKYHFDYKNIYNEERSIDLTDKKVVSSLGRVVRDKGFSELSRSMAEIMKDDPSVIFMVSGEIGNPVTQECREILKDVEDRVIFLPSLNQKEMARVYNVSSIFVMSSLNEAFGMVPIEAMGCKTAVIVGRSGFNDFAHCADIRDDNQDYGKAIGIYAPSQETDRWRQVKALKLLLNNEELRQKIAENGHRYVRENLTWQQISEQKDHIVQDVLSARKKSRPGKSKKNNLQTSEIRLPNRQKVI